VLQGKLLRSGGGRSTFSRLCALGQTRPTRGLVPSSCRWPAPRSRAACGASQAGGKRASARGWPKVEAAHKVLLATQMEAALAQVWASSANAMPYADFLRLCCDAARPDASPFVVQPSRTQAAPSHARSMSPDPSPCSVRPSSCPIWYDCHPHVLIYHLAPRMQS